jgi:hypothetical protein
VVVRCMQESLLLLKDREDQLSRALEHALEGRQQRVRSRFREKRQFAFQARQDSWIRREQWNISEKAVRELLARLLAQVDVGFFAPCGEKQKRGG